MYSVIIDIIAIFDVGKCLRMLDHFNVISTWKSICLQCSVLCSFLRRVRPANRKMTETRRRKKRTIISEVSSRKFPFLGGPSYIVKFAEDGQWQLLGTSLLQFTFEQGYECTIHVEKKMTDPSLADNPAWVYVCREVLTKEKKDSVIPENLL